MTWPPSATSAVLSSAATCQVANTLGAPALSGPTTTHPGAGNPPARGIVRGRAHRKEEEPERHRGSRLSEAGPGDREREGAGEGPGSGPLNVLEAADGRHAGFLGVAIALRLGYIVALLVDEPAFGDLARSARHRDVDLACRDRACGHIHVQRPCKVRGHRDADGVRSEPRFTAAEWHHLRQW